MIIYDYREKGLIVNLLNERFKARREKLDVGDFIISEEIGIERKTASDFEQSVIDGRLFQQAEKLKEHFEKPLIVIIGNDFKRLSKNALKGALISLIVDYSVPIVFLNDDLELAEFISTVVEREGKPPNLKKINFRKKGDDFKEQQLNVVESLPGVGPALARSLIERFKTIKNLFEADEKGLREVEGIGKVKAKKIKDLISKENS
jgi:Fanconi anemia group M protein